MNAKHAYTYYFRWHRYAIDQDVSMSHINIGIVTLPGHFNFGNRLQCMQFHGFMRDAASLLKSSS